jgi:hypothetical protein
VAEEFLVLGQKADQSVPNQSVSVSAKKVRAACPPLQAVSRGPPLRLAESASIVNPYLLCFESCLPSADL